MAKNKLKKFSDISDFEHVHEFVPPLPDHFPHKGKWREDVFKNDNPIVLELACGKGEYSVGMGKRFADKNFIGVDLKGSRIWKGATDAIELGLDNVQFLRMYIDHIDQTFDSNEINEIWIIFPDPFLRDRDERKRLTSSKFLNLYRKICTSDTIIHLKTDEPKLYNFTKSVIEEEGLEILEDVKDVYKESHSNDLLTSIQTFYEEQHLLAGRTISYISFPLFKNQ